MPAQPHKTQLPRTLAVLDHVGNRGGGIKYVLRLLDGLRASWRVELHAQPGALTRYQEAAAGTGLPLRLDWPLNPTPVLAERSPRLRAWLARHGQDHRTWTYRVRRPELAPGDVCFFPWLHRHDLTEFSGRGVGVFHDAIFFQLPELIGPARLALETENLRSWFARLDRVVVTSRHTKRRLLAVAGDEWADKAAVIPVADFDGAAPVPLPGPAATARFGRYLVMPAVASPHKNHRLLLQALAKQRGPWNLVLTGDGTRAPAESPLGRAIAESGLADRVFGLGHVDQGLVAQLIADAEALVMPTLGEGGGSFPVCEAIVAGTPVIASNLDVIAEQLDRMNAEATLFDPSQIDQLVTALDRLATAPALAKQRAQAQRARLRLRGWSDVARDFGALLTELYGATPPTREG